MEMSCLVLSILVSIVNAEFLIPTDEFGAGLTRITEQENAEVNEICGQQPGLNKINDGTIAKRGQFPWAVAIESNNEDRTCSGSIISQRHVLTAAHCVVSDVFFDREKCQNTEMTSVSNEASKDLVGGFIAYGGNCNYVGDNINKTGSPCKEDDMTRVAISSVAWDRRYRDRPENQRCTNFDIAIIEVAEDFGWSELVRPACLLLNDFNYTDLIATFSGFGGVKVEGKIESFPDLRYGAGKLLKNDALSIMSVTPKRMNERELKVEGTYWNSQVEQGDSGGGIVMKCARSLLVGVTTEQMSNVTKKTRGAQVNPHVPEICELTGVCPTDHCPMTN